jgi:Arc/MetJ family transcription regulator
MADLCRSRIYSSRLVYTQPVAKHLVDIDEDALNDAKRELGTGTLKDTVNLALRRAGAQRRVDIKRQLDVLAQADLAPREQAWR